LEASNTNKIDSCQRGFGSSDTSQATDDLLLPFALLTNDEDRERKAEYRAPGTYNVIATLESFANLKEYRGDKNMVVRNRVETLDDILADQQRANSLKSRKSSADMSEDPDILILNEFEDNIRRIPASGSLSAQSRTHGTSSSPVISSEAITQHTDSPDHEAQSIDISTLDGEDARLVSYYRDFICRQVVQVHNDSLGCPQNTGRRSVQEILETEATRFPPVSTFCISSTVSTLILAYIPHQPLLSFLLNVLRAKLPRRGFN